MPAQHPPALGDDARVADWHGRVAPQRLVQAGQHVLQLPGRVDVDLRLLLERRPDLFGEPVERVRVVEEQERAAREQRRRRLGSCHDEQAGVGLDVDLGHLLHVLCQYTEQKLQGYHSMGRGQLTQSSCFISSPSIRSWRTLPSSMRFATLLCVKTSCCSCDAIRLLGTIFRSSLVMVG